MQPNALVSVVTPFFNTAEFLTECIESVLRQTYQEWEYTLVDNCSTDGSAEIAEAYAARFPSKIRLLRTPSFLSQVQNYNFALSQISPNSRYCKMVQADDWLFPNCLGDMTAVAEDHPNVGIVSAYQLEGNEVNLDGLSYPCDEISGRAACRLYFLNNRYMFGTPTSLLFRSDLVRSRDQFFEERYAPFEDAHACFGLLKAWDLGFVHQVLTYSRLDDQSFVARARASGLLHFFHFSTVVMYGESCLSADEYRRCLENADRRYFSYLSRCLLRGRDQEFWELHRKQLATINQSLGWRRMAKRVPRVLIERAWEAFWEYWDKDSSIVADDVDLHSGAQRDNSGVKADICGDSRKGGDPSLQ